MYAKTEEMDNAMAVVAKIAIAIIFRVFIRFTSISMLACGSFRGWLKQK